MEVPPASKTIQADCLSADIILNALRERCSSLRGEKKQVILLGAPGSGKGTHSEWMKAEMHLCHLSTGDMLREAIREGTEVGKKAAEIVAAGKLVSDDVVIQIVRDKLRDAMKRPDYKGFLMDGFPRTLEQARAFDSLLKEFNTELSAVFYLGCDDQILEKRICGRLIHPGSGRTYHKDFFPPKVANKDDVTGEDLVQRPDDNPESLKIRLRAFTEATIPLIEYYKAQDKLFQLDAAQPADNVKQDIKSLFDLGASCLNSTATTASGAEDSAVNSPPAKQKSPSTNQAGQGGM